MRIRPKIFLNFAAVVTAPLLILSLFSFYINLQHTRTSLQSVLEHELVGTADAYEAALRGREQELLALASSERMVSHMKRDHPAAPRNENSSGPVSANYQSGYSDDQVAMLLRTQKAYSAIACFDPDRRLVFVAEPALESASRSIVFRTGDYLQKQREPDPRVWSAKDSEIVCSLVTDASAGKILRCATPVSSVDQPAKRGSIVSDLKLDSLLTEVMRRAELSGDVESGGSGPSSVIVVLDKSGEIVYHTNDALKHQEVRRSMPDFAVVSQSMMNSESGSKSYVSSAGDEWLAVYAPLRTSGLSLANARNVSLLGAGARRVGWLGIALALLLGVGVSLLLAHFYQRQTQGLERVTEGVAAIAKGELDRYIDARSRDDIRPLADSVNVMTERLRQQLAREADTRQFQAFVRLSAMLTHDLKNAIGSLSLLVANMEQHFDNEEFRADAMKSLTGATEKLQRLVQRISNPVTTLSGEFKKPEPVDLVPLIQRVVSESLEPVHGNHEIEIDLPPTLLALVDGERIEKVIENLVINGLEAMTGKTGKLTIKAGPEPNGTSDRVFLSVTDTGAGMSQRFIEDKLFHAFATTKKNGMGLGLYTCREVVAANRGTIKVESRQGAGTTFRVVLPSPPQKPVSRT